MQIYYHNPLAKDVWQSAKKYMADIPFRELLEGANIYLGFNPRPGLRKTSRGYYSPARKQAVVTENGFYENSKHLEHITDEWRADRALKTLLHEIGHHIHFSFLPYHSAAKKDPGLWEPWSEATGHELEFYRGGRHDTVRSYEEFANDFRDWLMGLVGGAARKRFYFGLWGQEYVMKIELEIGNKIIRVDGVPKEMDVAPFIQDGRTFVPLRFVSEALGARVDWDAATEKVCVYK